MNDSPVRRQGAQKRVGSFFLTSGVVKTCAPPGRSVRAISRKAAAGFKQVLEDILSEVQIKTLVIETQVFEIFAANSIHDLSRGDVCVIVTRNIPWRFIR